MVKTNRLRSGESQSKQRKIIALPDQKKKKKKKKKKKRVENLVGN